MHALRHDAYRERYERNKRRLGKQRGAKVAQIDIARRLDDELVADPPRLHMSPISPSVFQTACRPPGGVAQARYVRPAPVQPPFDAYALVAMGHGRTRA